MFGPLIDTVTAFNNMTTEQTKADLLTLIQDIKNGYLASIEEGPCSMA